MMDLEDFILTLFAVCLALIVWLCPGVFIATMLGFESWSAAWIVTTVGWVPIGAVLFFSAYIVVMLATMLLMGLASLIWGRRS